MCVYTDRSLPISAPIQVDAGGCVLLGEVCYCQPEAEEFRLGLKLEQVLAATGSLARLMQALQRQSSDVKVRETVKESRYS